MIILESNDKFVLLYGSLSLSVRYFYKLLQVLRDGLSYLCVAKDLSRSIEYAKIAH